MTDEKTDGETLNSINDIRKFLSEGQKPLEQGEFIQFWQSLSDEEKTEYLNTPLK